MNLFRWTDSIVMWYDPWSWIPWKRIRIHCWSPRSEIMPMTRKICWFWFGNRYSSWWLPLFLQRKETFLKIEVTKIDIGDMKVHVLFSLYSASWILALFFCAYNSFQASWVLSLEFMAICLIITDSRLDWKLSIRIWEPPSHIYKR